MDLQLSASAQDVYAVHLSVFKVIKLFRIPGVDMHADWGDAVGMEHMALSP